MTNPMLFDSNLKRLHRRRARHNDQHVMFLHAEVLSRLSDRVLDMDRRFTQVVQANGSQMGLPAEHPKIDQIVTLDLGHGRGLAADLEQLPVAMGCADLFFSSMALHWINDLPGTLAQISRALRPDGLFLAALLGGESFADLASCLADAETEISGGFAPRFSPTIGLKDAGALLQRAGFALPVVDTDRVTVYWPDTMRLMWDLKQMGEGNALLQRRREPLRPSVLARTAELYQERCGTADGKVSAVVDVIYMAGWRPGPGQQRALAPGSARHSLSQALA